MNVKELKNLIQGCDEDMTVFACPTTENPLSYGLAVQSVVITIGEGYGAGITLVYED